MKSFKYLLVLALAAVPLSIVMAGHLEGPDEAIPMGDDTMMRVKNIRADDVLWIRKGPSTDYDKVGALPHDCVCVVYLGRSGDWYKVYYRGVTGYAFSKYLEWDHSGRCTGWDSCPSRGAYYKVVKVPTDDVLWIRSGPSTSENKVGALPHNATCIQYVGKSGEWYKVYYRGITGYAHSKYLRPY